MIRGEHCYASFLLTQGKNTSLGGYLCAYKTQRDPDASNTKINPLRFQQAVPLSEGARGKTSVYKIKTKEEKHQNFFYFFFVSFFVVVSTSVTADLRDKFNPESISGKVR